jgi:hypothetical protein
LVVKIKGDEEFKRKKTRVGSIEELYRVTILVVIVLPSMRIVSY